LAKFGVDCHNYAQAQNTLRQNKAASEMLAALPGLEVEGDRGL
jgi:hypothetical protein